MAPPLLHHAVDADVFHPRGFGQKLAVAGFACPGRAGDDDVGAGAGHDSFVTWEGVGAGGERGGR